METAAQDRDASEVLARARLLVAAPLDAAVDSLPPSLRRIAGYHLGRLEADGRPAAGYEGKAVRPALALATVRALGGDPEQAARAAGAVELVHNFTLLHDDVMDGDLTRRHRPTAWSVFGSADAILAGDALHALALRLLAEDPHPAANRAVGRLAACVVELCEGQQADCAFERRGDVSLAECLLMAEAKTGALLGCACAIGALYAGADEEVADALDTVGRQVGLAFQLIDDLIGIWGDPALTGKPAGADLAARKKSLPVVAAWTSGGPAAAELAAIYRTDGPLDTDAVRRAAAAVEQAGAREWAQVQAADHMGTAVELLARTLPDRSAAGDLLAVLALITRRDR